MPWWNPSRRTGAQDVRERSPRRSASTAQALAERLLLFIFIAEAVRHGLVDPLMEPRRA